MGQARFKLAVGGREPTEGAKGRTQGSQGMGTYLAGDKEGEGKRRKS